MGRNDISDSGAASLSHALPVNSSLTMLDLRMTHISAFGVCWTVQCVQGKYNYGTVLVEHDNDDKFSRQDDYSIDVWEEEDKDKYVNK